MKIKTIEIFGGLTFFACQGMYFDFENNTDDPDDAPFNGGMPEDFREIVEQSCPKCLANERKLASDEPENTLTKKGFKSLRRALYKKMVDDGLIGFFVDALTPLCPNNIQELKILGSLLVNPKAGEIKDLKQRCRIVNEIYDKIRALRAQEDPEIPLKVRLDSITREMLEIKRARKNHENLSS